MRIPVVSFDISLVVLAAIPLCVFGSFRWFRYRCTIGTIYTQWRQTEAVLVFDWVELWLQVMEPKEFATVSERQHTSAHLLDCYGSDCACTLH
jgi:hypothetical protein